MSVGTGPETPAGERDQVSRNSAGKALRLGDILREDQFLTMIGPASLGVTRAANGHGPLQPESPVAKMWL
jgi:hypothetical protein